ncbi:MAG: SpoIIE family protein phosphatase [Candidatus Eutrophobiaceae bacterium]
MNPKPPTDSSTCPDNESVRTQLQDKATEATEATETMDGITNTLKKGLGLLADLTQSFSISADVEKTMIDATEQITRYMRAEAASIFLLEDNGKQLVCRGCAGPVDILGLAIQANSGIVGKAIATREAQLVRNALSDPNFSDVMDNNSGFITRSLLCVPLIIREECIGALELVNKRGGSLFNKRDLEFCQVLAASAAQAIQNARMTGKLLGQQRIQRELELARDIQKNMLARKSSASDVPIAGINIPAYEVSGDFYDFFRRPDGLVYFSIADVSGKGINAALLTAQAGSLLRQAARSAQCPGQLLTQINVEICASITRGMFITAVSGFIDERNHSVSFANAGHQPPLLHSHKNTFREFSASQPPLGILPNIHYETIEVDLADGILYLFTDGFTESRLEDGSEFGTEGAKQLIRHCAATPLNKRPNALAQELQHCCPEQRDDLTLLAIELDSTPNAASALTPILPSYPACRGRPLATIKVPAIAANLELIRNVVCMALAQTKCPKETTQQIALAVNEACMNIIEHAYSEAGAGGAINLQMSDNSGAVMFLLEDTAPLVNLTAIHSRSLEDIRPGGLGVHFIKELMDDCLWGHRRERNGNFLWMRKNYAATRKQEN